MTVFGRAPARVPKQVTLTCRTPAGPWSWAVPVAHAEDLGGVIPLMWARRTIQSLEELNDVPRTSAATTRSREQEMLVSISKQFGLVCSLTSFIAVEHRSVEERNEGKPALRRIPTALAAEWGGMLGELTGGAVAACAPMASSRSFATPAQAGGAVRRRMRGLLGNLGRGGKAKAGRSPAASPPLPAVLQPWIAKSAGDGASALDLTRASDDSAAGVPLGGGGNDAAFGAVLDEIAPFSPAVRDLTRLLASQTADGSFEGGAAGFDDDARRHLERVVTEWLAGGPVPGENVLTTIAAVVRLRSSHSDDRDLWRRAERKALRWLADALNRPQADVDAWLDMLAKDSQLSIALIK
jgi:hypothetical protein